MTHFTVYEGETIPVFVSKQDAGDYQTWFYRTYHVHFEGNAGLDRGYNNDTSYMQPGKQYGVGYQSGSFIVTLIIVAVVLVLFFLCVALILNFLLMSLKAASQPKTECFQGNNPACLNADGTMGRICKITTAMGDVHHICEPTGEQIGDTIYGPGFSIPNITSLIMGVAVLALIGIGAYVFITIGLPMIKKRQAMRKTTPEFSELKKIGGEIK